MSRMDLIGCFIVYSSQEGLHRLAVLIELMVFALLSRCRRLLQEELLQRIRINRELNIGVEASTPVKRGVH